MASTMLILTIIINDEGRYSVLISSVHFEFYSKEGGGICMLIPRSIQRGL